MTSATEMLRALLDERGVEYEIRGMHYTVWHSERMRCDAEAFGEPERFSLTLEPITPEQAIAATLGGQPAKLTAEQVREAIEANSWAETSTIREFNDSSWQAIADELNATLGGDSNTRWFQLFGTPERAARMLEKQCDLSHCVVCPAYHRAPCDEGDYVALLEWLRGDA